MSDEISEWRVLGSKPIRPDTPSGDSVRYDPAFEQLQEEINKLESLSGQAVDWKEVVNLSTNIIEKKSKDLLVACYLCGGLFEEQGYYGLLAGLACIEEMVTSYWESLYPEAKRMRGRINAISWLSEKVGSAVSGKGPQAKEIDLVNGCIQEIETIENLLKEKIGRDSPGLGTLKHSIREQLQVLEFEKKPSGGGEGAAKVESVVEPQAEAPAVVTGISSMDDARRALEGARDIIRRAAGFVQSEAPSIPWPYRVIRTLTWMEMDAPPSDTDGETRIPPPPERIPDQFHALVEQGAWTELLDQVESRVDEYPFWMDLHYLSVQALSGLGPSYAAAKEAVSAELANLLRRIPALLELQFSDGTPFADDQTRRWLETDILTPATGKLQAGSAEGAPAEGVAGHLAGVCEEAYRLMGEGKLKEAVGLFQQEMSSASFQRERFLIRLELARLCLDAGHPKVAISQLDDLDRQISKFSLEEWEPELSMDVLQTLYLSLNRLLQDSNEVLPWLIQQVDMVYKRLCRLDVFAALDMDGKKKRGRR